MKLSPTQSQHYAEMGYLVIRDVWDESDIQRAEQGIRRNMRAFEASPGVKYPQAGRYTLANNCIEDPDLAFVAELPAVIECVEQILADSAVLSAFVVYNRTPGGRGIGPHNDYKRWRPAGSSMNWLFAILPLCDHDSLHGPLFVSPGSHKLKRFHRPHSRVVDVLGPEQPDSESFVDPEVKRGDLLLLNMHCWHKAGANLSSEDRLGFFNKYCAASAPPATGHYVYSNASRGSLTRSGQRLIACWSDKPIASTRLLLQRGDSFLVNEGRGGWTLPGGKAEKEGVIPDWDSDNYIASLYKALRCEQKIEVPWATYVGDYEEHDGLCRIYAYEMGNHEYFVPYDGTWVGHEALLENGAFRYELELLKQWNDRDVMRGKGVTQMQGRIDQFAY